MKALLLLPFFVACAPAPASAAVYLDDAVIDDATNIPTLAFPPWTGMGRVFHLTQSPNGFVVVEVNRIGSTASFEFIHQSIAAYYSLCVVNSGEELTYLNVLSKPTLGGFGSGNTLTLNPGKEAYIGYWSQRGSKPPNPTPEPDSIIGWARVTNTAGNLVLISSASADTGIIVGTAQDIPEPGPALLASAASLLLFRRRRDRGSRMSGSLILPLPIQNVNPRGLTPFTASQFFSFSAFTSKSAASSNSPPTAPSSANLQAFPTKNPKSPIINRQSKLVLANHPEDGTRPGVARRAKTDTCPMSVIWDRPRRRPRRTYGVFPCRD